MRSELRENVRKDQEGPMQYKLLGQSYSTTYNNEVQKPGTLPPDLLPINFALKHLSMSLREWSDLDRKDAGEQFNQKHAEFPRPTPMDKSQVALFITKRFLVKDPFVVDDQEAQEAAMILVNLKSEDLQMAADVVKTMKETRWPPAAVGNMVLCILQNLLYGGRDGVNQDPCTERIFASNQDLSAYIDNVMATCTTIVASKVEGVLKGFCTSKDAPHVSPVDLREASELIAFLNFEDIDMITSVISSLGDFRMPVAGIANAVAKALETAGPDFFRTIEDNMARQVARSVPSPFPTTGLSRRERSASRESYRSVRDNPDSRARLSTSKGAASAEWSPEPENRPSTSRKAEKRPATRTPSPPESSVSALVRSRKESPLPVPKSASAVRISGALTSRASSVSVNPTGYSATSSVIGKGPHRFKWWNIRLSEPVADPSDLHLLEIPQPGDILSYYIPSLNSAAMFQREALAWVNITRNFFLNNGKTKHPLFPDDDPRFLTWKSKSNKTPTYVVKSTFDSKRHLMQATTDGPVDFESLLHRKGATTAFWDYLDLYERVSGYHTTRPESTTTDSRKIKVTQLPIDQAAMPHSAPAFIGTKTRSQKIPPIGELLQEGYQLIEYDGNIHVFTDIQDRVVLTVIPMPEELVEAGLNHALVTDMFGAQANIEFSASNATDLDDCNRGDFRTISTGISHGGGQKEPRNLNHTTQNSSAIFKLLRSSAVRSVARWQSECYKTWMPKLFAANEEVLDKLLQWKPTLSPNFSSSVFCSTTFNFGPRVVCDFHLDHLNWASGMCAITSGGNFDFKKGGHLVLKEYKLIVEFPPCLTILLPSALVTHGNSPIGPGEHRISMTQYTAGGLYRWVEYGFRPSRDYQLEASKAEDRPIAVDSEQQKRWERNVELLSKVSDMNHHNL